MAFFYLRLLRKDEKKIIKQPFFQFGDVKKQIGLVMEDESELSSLNVLVQVIQLVLHIFLTPII